MKLKKKFNWAGHWIAKIARVCVHKTLEVAQRNGDFQDGKISTTSFPKRKKF